MLAVKRGRVAIARIILEFGIDPAILLLKDAEGSTPLHVAVQNTNTVLAELLLKHGPTQLLYTENSVGQTPQDIASLKGLPRVTGPVGVTPEELPWDGEPYLHLQQLQWLKVPPLGRQRTKIAKLRATLDTLLADGHIVPGTQLATEIGRAHV